MKVVVEISERAYEAIKEHGMKDIWGIGEAIVNGTILPKGHGRLIDADLLSKQYGLEDATKYGNKNAKQQGFSYSTMMMYEIADIIDDAPTILEATEVDNDRE